MKQSLQMQLSQQLTITPQLQQAIHLLLLSTPDLLNEIQDQLESNSMLEMSENGDEPDSIPAWQENLQQKTRSSNQSTASGDNFPEIQDNTDKSLRSHLTWQMEMTPFNEEERQIAIALIDAIDDSGYLSCNLEDIKSAMAHEQLEPSDSEIEHILNEIQHYDPFGVGSRNLQEFLMLQLKALAPDTEGLGTATTLVSEHMALMAKHDYQQIRRLSKFNKQNIAAAVNLIKSLKPRPNYEYMAKEPEAIIPDLVVKKAKGQWTVRLTADLSSRIKINDQYAGMVQRADSSRDNQFLKNQLQEARWFLKSLQNRNDTLLRVAACIMENQVDFLEQGELAIKPLTLATIAESTELHESTISRVTTNKYIQTSRGVFELKYFFSSQLQTDSGDGASSTAIKASIKNIVGNEPDNKPYSDNKIAQLLEEQGIHVARRTIAKYREALNIPPSNERKRMKAIT